MKNVDEIIKKADEVRKIRISTKEIEEYKIETKAQKSQIEEMDANIIQLRKSILDQDLLQDRISKLEEEIKIKTEDLENLKKDYTFVVTCPAHASRTVYGEISRAIDLAKKEIHICSPWITYILDELDSVNKRGNIKVKVITRLVKEDIETGFTDLNKLRALRENYGAEIRYNNNLHAKMIIVDGKVAVISSANITESGLKVNYEAGISITAIRRCVL